MRRHIPILSLILFILICCSSQINNKKKVKYVGIERTLSLLNESTKEKPNDIEVLFYGQSIIGGMKTNILIDSLKKRFPFANIIFKHKPIGGFTIPSLIKTAEHDIYQENPDLIIFHAYGGIKDGLFDSLINNIRHRMSSDILLFDHHYVWNKPINKLESINKSHEFDSKEIKKIADKYNCGFVNVREQWGNYLEKNNITANELVGNTVDPNVHPNKRGNELLRSILLSNFSLNKKPEYNPEKDELREEFNVLRTNNKIGFEGNKLLLYTNTKDETETKLEIFIDQKKPSELKENYYITRPSKGYQSWMPMVSLVSFGETFPRFEKWTLELFDINRKNQSFKFKLIGDIAGFDGEGDSNSNFISNSKRIMIEGRNFNVFRIEKITNKNTPENYKVTFNIKSIVNDTVIINKKKHKYILFSDYKSSRHDLELKVLSGTTKLIKLVAQKPYIISNE